MSPFYLIACESTLLREIGTKTLTRLDIAKTYALTLMSSEYSRVNWGNVNRAIIYRWSLNALEYIKHEAWMIVEGRR